MSTKHLCVLSLDHSKVQPKYAWAALLHDPFVRSQIDRTGHGAIMEGWNMGLVRRLTLRVPPIALQQLFVDRCHECEGIVDEQERAALIAEQTLKAISAKLLS